MWLKVVILGFLGINAWTDWKKQQISLWITGIMCVAGFFWTWYVGDIDFLYFVGPVIGLCIIGVSFLTGGEIGMGDGLVILALGTILEWEKLVVSLILGLLGCAASAGYLMIVRHKGRKTRIPFIPYLFFGYIGGLFL